MRVTSSEPWFVRKTEGDKRRLAGDTARAATSDEAKDLRREAQALKEVVADLTLENRRSKKHDRGWGRRGMRYSASDKTEISGWSSNHIWRLDARWRNSAFPDRPYRWYDQYQRGDRKPSRIDPHGRIGSGTVSQRLSAGRLSTWRWISRNSARGNWRCASRTSKNTLS